MAAFVQVPAIVVENYRVEHGEGFSLPVITLTDRRAAGNRLVRFVFQRHRARCRGCKGVIERGELRLVTRAFVRPGRSRNFARHVGCVSVELLRAVIAAHGSTVHFTI